MQATILDEYVCARLTLRPPAEQEVHSRLRSRGSPGLCTRSRSEGGVWVGGALRSQGQEEMQPGGLSPPQKSVISVEDAHHNRGQRRTRQLRQHVETMGHMSKITSWHKRGFVEQARWRETLVEKIEDTGGWTTNSNQAHEVKPSISTPQNITPPSRHDIYKLSVREASTESVFAKIQIPLRVLMQRGALD